MVDDTYTPRRRGRPPQEAKAETTPQKPEAAAPEKAAVEPKKRRRRASIGVAALKLDAPSRPGYIRRFVNDDDNRIANMQELAYDFVHEQGIQSDALGSRVSRLVGTKKNGEPLRAYLMETPEELYAEGAQEKEAHNSQIDEAIKAGRDFTGRLNSSENAYGQGSIKVER